MEGLSISYVAFGNRHVFVVLQVSFMEAEHVFAVQAEDVFDVFSVQCIHHHTSPQYLWLVHCSQSPLHFGHSSAQGGIFVSVILPPPANMRAVQCSRSRQY